MAFYSRRKISASEISSMSEEQNGILLFYSSSGGFWVEWIKTQTTFAPVTLGKRCDKTCWVVHILDKQDTVM